MYSRITSARFCYAATAIAAGIGLAGMTLDRSLAEEPAPGTAKIPAAVKPLLLERMTTAKKILEITEQLRKLGTRTMKDVHLANIDLFRARLGLAENKAETVKVHEEIVAEARQFEEKTIQAYQAAAADSLDVLGAQLYRLDSDINLRHAVGQDPANAPQP